MAKKKQRKGKEQLPQEKGKARYSIEIRQNVSDIKTFIDNFKSDVEKKKREYQSYVRNFAKKKFKKSKF